MTGGVRGPFFDERRVSGGFLITILDSSAALGMTGLGGGVLLDKLWVNGGHLPPHPNPPSRGGEGTVVVV